MHVHLAELTRVVASASRDLLGKDAVRDMASMSEIPTFMLVLELIRRQINDDEQILQVESATTVLTGEVDNGDEF